MTVAHQNNSTAANLGLSSSTSTTFALPTHSVGELLTITALGTPDVTAGTPSVTFPSGWSFLAEKLQDASGINTDLYIGVWWKVAGASEPDPTISWSTGFTTSTSSISNSRISLIGTSWSGQADVPQVATTSGATTPSSPFTPAGYTLVRNSAAVTIAAQRFATAPTIATANGWTSHGTLTSGGLARSLNFALKAGQTAGAMTMPTFTVDTGSSTSALASITFDIPEQPVGAPGIYVDGAVHVA